MKEYILCAANYYNDNTVNVFNPININVGFIICGHRHHNCIDTFAKMFGFPYSEEVLNLKRTEIQGFITNTNKFLNREEALVVARDANQVLDEAKVSGLSLHSEDLY